MPFQLNKQQWPLPVGDDMGSSNDVGDLGLRSCLLRDPAPISGLSYQITTLSSIQPFQEDPILQFRFLGDSNRLMIDLEISWPLVMKAQHESSR